MSTAFRGAIWKMGTKDAKVYVELWDHDDTRKLVDTELSPDQAYDIGKSLMDFAIKQGHEPAYRSIITKGS